MKMRLLGRFVLIASVCGLAPAAALADQDVRSYVTQAGDTCMGIAARELGSASAYKTIHTLNPGLGPEPHKLPVGLTLFLPTLSPDAQIADTLGNVEFRKPEQSLWSAAARGIDLFRAWRVKTERRAAANVAFPDKSELTLREESVLIVYGPTKDRTKTIRARAELQNGSLQTRLADLDAKPLLISTSAGEAEMRSGSAVVRLDAEGNQAVSNLRGKKTVVRGIVGPTKPGGASRVTTSVSVPEGMGTKVMRGQAPMKPRPLPRAPTLSSQAMPPVFALEGVGTALISWEAVPAATQYLASVRRNTDAAPIVMATLPGSATSWRPIVDQSGDYVVSISTIDKDGLESGVNTANFTFVVVKGDTSLALQGSQRGYAVGTLISATGWTCRQASNAPFVEAQLLTRPGVVDIACIDANGREGGFAVPVFPIQLELSASPLRAGDIGEIRISLPSPDVGYEALASPGLTLLPSANTRALSFRVNASPKQRESVQITRSGVVIATIEVPTVTAR